MDHIDRRKNANDVQGLFYESLMSGSELAGLVNDLVSKKKWDKAANKLKSKINMKSWKQKVGYYYDTITRDGSKDDSIRPNPLIFVLTGAVSETEKIKSV